jgi:hypothetical protein
MSVAGNRGLSPIIITSRSMEPVWDGEILHTDGSDYKVRYLFDDSGAPLFMASDICVAIGQNAPNLRTNKWGGGELVKQKRQPFFTDSGVQDYLVSLAVKNRLSIFFND